MFVTLHKNSDLRGCIGTYLPTRDNIIEEIIMNAIAASTEDPRFPLYQSMSYLQSNILLIFSKNLKRSQI